MNLSTRGHMIAVLLSSISRTFSRHWLRFSHFLPYSIFPAFTPFEWFKRNPPMCRIKKAFSLHLGSDPDEAQSSSAGLP
jgi:hypothetical protein